MRKTASVLVIIFTLICADNLLAQNKEEPDPKNIWQEYMSYNPSTKDLSWMLLVVREDEPYKDWIISELFTRDLIDLDKVHLRHLLNHEMPKKNHDQIWRMIESDINLDELASIYVNATEANKKRVLEILDGRFLTNIELVSFMPLLDEELEGKSQPHFRIFLDKFLAGNPTNDDLIYMMARGSYRKFARDEILKRPLSNQELLRIMVWSDELEYREKIISRMSLPELSGDDLKTIVSLGIEPYSSLAEQILESYNYHNKEKRKEELVSIMTGIK